MATSSASSRVVVASTNSAFEPYRRTIDPPPVSNNHENENTQESQEKTNLTSTKDTSNKDDERNIVTEWLRFLQLDVYVSDFMENGYDELEVE